ncbi:hypothetical protein XENOCAPTIV_016896 [Xenoophorus captivus]|uniref:Ras-GEF domain-containing protein n=1 Tax=Xenoophorus captivus TaxID=1517983 RepID=A0ABV0S2A3_9TELE
MPPTTPYAGKFNSCPSYSNNNHVEPPSPYRGGSAPKPSRDNLYNGAYSPTENPYDVPQSHSSYRSTSVSSVSSKEHHYGSSCAISENPYSPPQPHSPRQHSTSCPGRAYRHTSSSCSSEHSCRNNGAAAKARLYGHGIATSYGEMCYHDNSLVSASLEALIQHLIRFREVAPKLVQLLTEWTETFPYDFRDDRMMRCLKDMTLHVARGDEQMTQRLIKRLSALGQYEEAVAALNAAAQERPASLKTKQASAQRTDILSVCDDPFILAQQLTHIELDRLSFIGPEEFIQSFAMKDPLENHKVSLSENILSIVSFLQIVIPFFSLLIKDIYFLNEGCANRLPNGHINFEKLWELAKQVSEFLVWRQVICPFDRDRRILQYLVTTPVYTEDELHLASYESEGPENNMEKDSRRSLRIVALILFRTKNVWAFEIDDIKTQV